MQPFLEESIVPPDDGQDDLDFDFDGLEFVPGDEPVPGYRLVSRIGAGSTGEVWKAIGPGGFPVALKFIVEGYNGATDEIHSLSQIKDVRHANLITIFGTWELDGLLIVGMDLADGTLLERCDEAIGRGNPGIPFRELATYMEQAARGLDFLNRPHHRLNGREDVGLLHRDVKPQNLLLVGGSVKVGDFGLVTSLKESAEFCGSESLAPAYIPPEWAEGRLSGRSDQYALAMTYCRLSAGRLPSPTDAAGPAPSPGGLDLSMLPEGQRPALARALASDPDDRWPDCLTFVQELTRTASLEDVKRDEGPKADADRTIPPPERPRLPARGLRGWSRIAAEVSLILPVLATGYWLYRVEGARQSRGRTRPFETANPRDASENVGPGVRAIPGDRASTGLVAVPSPSPLASADDVADPSFTRPDDVADPSPASLTKADVATEPVPSLTKADAVVMAAAMTERARGTIRHAVESFRRGVAFLERKKSDAGPGVGLAPGAPKPPVPVEAPAELPAVPGFVGPLEETPGSDPPPPEAPKPEPSRLVAVVEKKAIDPRDPSRQAPRKPGAAEATSKAKERVLAEAVAASRPRAATITVFLPSANGELVVRGEVGKGNPDEWYGPTRVIHSPPLSESKEYLVGSFWTDETGRQLTRSKALKVGPGRAYEVDLRAPIPTSKEVDRNP